MARDVFEEHPSGLDLSDDPADIGPEVPLVILAPALSGHAERLAGVSGKDGVDGAPEGSAVKGGNVIPDRGRSEVSGSLCGDKGASGVFLPFNRDAGVETGLCEHEAHIEATTSCAEGQSVPGAWHHVIPQSPRRRIVA